MVEWIGCEEHAAPWFRDGGAFRHDDHVGESGDGVGTGHHGEFTEGEGIGWWSEFAGVFSLFEVEAVLDVMPAAGIAAIVSGVEAAFGVE